MQFLDKDISPLGLGCWPIGGKMYASDGLSLGYSNTNDEESINALHAAIANGITLFDTAAAYGAGHAERLLGKALKNHPDAQVITKIGIRIDEAKKMLLGDEIDPESVIPAIDRCLARLDRESIDLVLLHNNSLPVEQAKTVFDEMDIACQQGKIKSYGWSTDYTASVQAMADRREFVAVEHAMHVLMDAPSMQSVVQKSNLYAIIRSPLAMGLLSGKYNTQTILPKDDIRASNQGWLQYYINGKPNPQYMDRFNQVRELLQTNGRTPVQGALAWLWAKSPDNSNINIPIPGARTVEQVEGLAAAIALGPLPEEVVNEIANLVGDENVSEGESDR